MLEPGLPVRAPSRPSAISAYLPLAVVSSISMIWIPSLRHGFASDDFDEVPIRWRDILANPFIDNARPVEALSFALVPDSAVMQHAESLLLYLGCIWVMWCICRRARLDQWSTLLALTSFLHPSFLWSVTWIAHRADLLIILFALLTLVTTSAPARLACVVLSNAAKTPYLFHNMVFAYRFAKRKAFAASAVAIAAMAVFALGAYMTLYQDAVHAANNLTTAPIAAAAVVPLRLAKIVEGILYVFAPIPMFAVVPWGPVAALFAYGTLWWLFLQSAERSSGRPGIEGISVLAITMCVPFAFVSEVRATGPAAVFIFLAISTVARWTGRSKIAVVGILVLNLTGIVFNYGMFRSRQYDIRGTPVPFDYSQPAYVYQVRRDRFRQRVFAAFDVRVPARTFE